MNYKSQTVSAVVMTENNAATLEHCLSSLHWADELIIFDCGSTDGTLAIARNFTEKVYFHPSSNLTAVRRDALSMGACDWLLLVEPDEWVEEMLRHEIEGVLLNTSTQIQGYTIPRKLKFQGQWAEKGAGEPDRALRLIRRKGDWSVGAGWDACLQVNGDTGRLDRPLGYAPFKTVEELFASVNTRSTLSAYKHLETRGLAPGDQGTLNLIWQTKLSAYKHFLFGGGLQDGFVGLTMAMAATLETFLKFAKIRSLTRKA